MRSQAGSVKFSPVLRASTACLLALSVSACSSETMRFTDTPFASPFKSAQAPAPARDPATTGSIGRSANTPIYATPAPATAAVRSQPLPPPQSAVALRSAAPQPVAGNASGWSAQGGTPIVVAQGETLDMISSRYGVPKAALISANGLSSSTIAPGSRLTIPVYSAAGAAPAPRQQVAQAPSETRSDASRFVTGPAPSASLAPIRPAAPVQDVRARAAAEAKSSTAPSKAAAAAEAKAKAEADALAMRESRARFAAEAKAKAAAKASAPAAAPKPVAVAKPVAEKPVVAEAKPVRAPAPEKAKPVVVASAPATEPKVTAVPKSEPEPAATTASLAKPEEAGEKADFRWPARGRVIAGFSGRGGNEGINIAVPEGTPIKAAEGGTVAYAGNELKGYGNLVLIRHPNGYVSAYAHAGELNVKRGETVKRGQVVAKSGQTGNVSSPQLHFELRKGSSPVDPTPYLNN